MVETLRTDEAAKFLGLSPWTVRIYAQAGRIGTKIGRDWRFTMTELRRFKRKPRPVGNPAWRNGGRLVDR